MPAPQPDALNASANVTSDTDLPSAESAAVNSGPAVLPMLEPLTLAFWAAAPHSVFGKRASRSLASLGRLKPGAASLAGAADGSVLAGAVDGSTEAGASDAAVADWAAALGIGVAAAPHPQSVMSRLPAAIAATVR